MAEIAPVQIQGVRVSKTYSVSIVGESHYQRAITSRLEGTAVELVHEPKNPHDDRAIRVDNHKGQTIGYVPRGSWLTRAILDEGKNVSAVVDFVGEDGSSGNFGVTLEVTIDAPGRSVPAMRDKSSTAADQVGKMAYGCIALILFALFLFMMSAMG